MNCLHVILVLHSHTRPTRGPLLDSQSPNNCAEQTQNGECKMRSLILLDVAGGASQALYRAGSAALISAIADVASASDVHHQLDAAHPRLFVFRVSASQQIPDLILSMRQRYSDIPLILAVSGGSEELAVASFRAGIADYFHLPGEEGELLDTVHFLLHSNDAPAPAIELSSKSAEFPFIGESPTMNAVRLSVERIAASDSNVLITGETGTGKELVASAIHKLSTRRNHPFVCVNCAAIPDALFESEWFGYERGAFTGAHVRNAGWMESSHHGTMFLDEIGEMSLLAQAKLLRVIESKEFHRLGGKSSVRVDVRFVAATNRNLEATVSEGKFRQDLYYRLNIARVHLPPLRERKGDIPPLLRHYMREFSTRNQNHVDGMTDDVWNCLLGYEWPGNIRELKNVLESIFVNTPQGKICFGDLPEEFRKRIDKCPFQNHDEREQLITALMHTKWNKSKAAEELHWSRMTLYRKMHKYRIYIPGSS